jgi:hypothetical protein
MTRCINDCHIYTLGSPILDIFSASLFAEPWSTTDKTQSPHAVRTPLVIMPFRGVVFTHELARSAVRHTVAEMLCHAYTHICCLTFACPQNRPSCLALLGNPGPLPPAPLPTQPLNRPCCAALVPAVVLAATVTSQMSPLQRTSSGVRGQGHALAHCTACRPCTDKPTRAADHHCL